MSTAEQIIAEHRLDDFDGTCFCGEWSYEDEPYDPADPELASMHSAHVVAALTNAGKAIVELPEADSTSGLSQEWRLPQSNTVIGWVDGEVSIDGHLGGLTVTEARQTAAALLAAARVAEGGDQP